MPSTGFPLTGISPQDPTPGIRRELLFAQGNTSTAGKRRDVVLVGNKTSSGSETTNTLGTAVLSSQDMEDRFGLRSELRWMYNKYVSVDPLATIYAIAVPEGGGAAAATKTVTFTTTATSSGTIVVEWGGESIQVSVASGDTAIVQAAALTAKINQQPYWPFTAAQGAPTNDHIVTLTAANLGPRSDYSIARVRCRALKSYGTTIAVSSVASGTTADDFTTALSALTAAEIYYHVAACTATAGVTATDNGVGEYITSIVNEAMPAVGKEQIVCFGLLGTQSQATTVATSSAANSVRAVFWHAENNDWTPAMLAAHCTAVKRSQEIAHPAANLRDYTNSDSTPFQVPDPYDKNDRPTATEISADLDNGVSPIAFDNSGAAKIVRQVTSRSWLGSSATKDYRAREGYIVSVIDYAWSVVKSRYVAIRQPHIAADPADGQLPVKGMTYPRDIKALILGVIDDLAGPFVGSIPLFDPSPDAIARMKKSVAVVDMNDGTSATADFEPVRANDKGNFRINQAGPSY
jgi:phage tail sheath gpL-like